jgi:hypothetical protein
MTNAGEKSPTETEQEDREGIKRFMDDRFPDQRRLEDLRVLLSEEQQKLLRFERENAPEEGLNRIRGSIKELEAEIEALRATGNFPAPSR